MSAFQRLKPLCVPLMALRPLTPATQSTTRDMLRRLLDALQAIPDPEETFNPGLIQYVLFPLSHLLTRNNLALTAPTTTEAGYIADTTLEPLFACLAFLVRQWTRLPQGMDVRMWEELWRMVVLVVGGPMGRVPKDKGKQRQRSEETIEAGVELLGVLLGHGSQDGTTGHPSRAMLDLVFTAPSTTPRTSALQRRLLPLLFHSISTLIDISTTASSPQLTARALDVLHTTLRIWFDTDKAHILASIMPGLVSGVVKVVCGVPTPAQPRGFQAGWNELASAPASGPARTAPTTGVVCAALRVFVQVIVQTVGDVPLEACGVLQGQAGDLEELVRGLEVVDGVETVVGSPESRASLSTTRTINDSAPTDPFPPLTATYLAFTRTQLLTAMQALFPPLTHHHAPPVRLALVETVARLLQECNRSLTTDDPIQHLLLTTLLRLAPPSEDPTVASASRTAIRKLMTDPSTARRVQAGVRTIMERELAGFGAGVMSASEARVSACVDILSALAALAIDSSDEDRAADVLRRDFAHLLGPNGGVYKWSWGLVRCLELGRPVEMEMDGKGGQGTSRPWDMARIEGSAATTTLEDSFPRMYLRHIESRTMHDRVARMFEAVGAAAGVSSLTTVEQLLVIARTSRARADRVALASSALWLVGRVVDGLAGVMPQDSVADARDGWVDVKRVRKAARRVVDLVVQFDEDSEHPAEDTQPTDDAVASDVTVIERRRGLNTISKLLDDSRRTPTSATAHASRLHAAVHAELVTCLNLSLLASCARILSTSFRKHLLSTLYIILSHLGSPHAFVRRYAEVALTQVSYHAGYASAQNMILDNVDYVIDIVSQRMTYDRLDTLAPMVLISMIKLVGMPIVPLVQDIIADVFDALDDFHGYAALSSAVLAVMDTLMKAMAAEVPGVGQEPPASASVRMRRAPDPTADFVRFTTWYADRAVKARETMDEMLDRAPGQPWGQPKEAPAPDAEGPSNASAEPDTLPPTRAQEVCIQMMQKSVYFLTHANPFITARVLSLFASGVPVLITQDRESDALPLVHQAWPFVLNRLQDPAPFVRTEAAALVECLARWAGDFMSRRILDDAWPIFRRLLDEQKQRDNHSALAHRSVRGTTSAYTVSHRLYLSIIHAMHLVIQRVPIADDLFWEIILALRPFLDSRVHKELGAAAVKVYQAMAERDQDAVWLALNATMGTVVGDQQLPTYLREPGLDIRHTAELVM